MNNKTVYDRNEIKEVKKELLSPVVARHFHLYDKYEHPTNVYVKRNAPYLPQNNSIKRI